MGILTELFVATHTEAEAYEETLLENPEAAQAQYSAAQFRGLTDLNFSALWAVLEGEVWSSKKHALTLVKLEESGETWLFQFPQPFCAKLAALTDAAVRSTSDAWTATEELSLDGWSVDEVLPVVEKLRALAKRAEESGGELFLWGSL